MVVALLVIIGKVAVLAVCVGMVVMLLKGEREPYG